MTAEAIPVLIMIAALGVALLLAYVAGIGWGARFMMRVWAPRREHDDIVPSTIVGVFWPLLLAALALRALARLITRTNILRLLATIVAVPVRWAWNLGYIGDEAPEASPILPTARVVVVDDDEWLGL